jgi:hypothetical protein
MTSGSLKKQLAVLVAAVVLPLLVFAVAVMWQQLEEKRELVDRGMEATARALTLAVDGEVKASLGVLNTIGSSPLLDTGNLKSFHELCVRAMAGRRGAYVILFDAAGNALVNSSRPFGSPLPSPLQSAQPPGFDPRFPEVPTGGAEPVRNVLTTGKPFISNLFISLNTHQPRIGLDIPVRRDGELRYVLQLSMDSSDLSRLLAEQGSPDGSMLTIVDRQGIAIASSINTVSTVGKALPPDLAGHIANAASGAAAGRDAEGREVYHVFNASALTGWRTSLTVARSAAYAPVSDAMTWLGIGAAIAVVIAVLAAFGFGRRVTRHVGGVVEAAKRPV